MRARRAKAHMIPNQFFSTPSFCALISTEVAHAPIRTLADRTFLPTLDHPAFRPMAAVPHQPLAEGECGWNTHCTGRNSFLGRVACSRQGSLEGNSSSRVAGNSRQTLPFVSSPAALICHVESRARPAAQLPLAKSESLEAGPLSPSIPPCPDPTPLQGLGP